MHGLIRLLRGIYSDMQYSLSILGELLVLSFFEPIAYPMGNLCLPQRFELRSLVMPSNFKWVALVCRLWISHPANFLGS